VNENKKVGIWIGAILGAILESHPVAGTGTEGSLANRVVSVLGSVHENALI
jgi:hypothetical protein